ncbi:MAG: hypothetical protein JMDDDDMK_04699 [Acidobacteria bacterium]|nr:hypothetical protein [Acidobacteriota bacterium]
MIAISDNHGYVLSPLTIAPVNKSDIVLLPDGIKDLKHVASEAGLDLKGATLNLDAGFDSKANRKCIFNAGMKPNIKENPRNRKTAKRGRKRFFDYSGPALKNQDSSHKKRCKSSHLHGHRELFFRAGGFSAC